MANGLFLLFVAGLFVLAFIRPGTACGLTLSGFVIEQVAQAFVPMAGTSNALFNYVVGVAVLIAISRQLLRRGPYFLLPGPATWATLILLGYTWLTVAWSLFPSTTEEILLKALPSLVLFAFLAPLTVQSPADIEDALLFLIFGTSGSLLILLIFAQWEGRSVYLPYADHSSNPLALTQAAGSVLVSAALTGLVRKASGRFITPVAVAIAAVVLITFIRTQSRGQILGAVGVTALFSAVIRRGRLWLALGALGSILIITSGFLQEDVAVNATRWNQHQIVKDVGQDRFGQAERLFDYWLASNPTHQVLGLGHASAQDPRLVGAYPHIVPIEVLCEEGLVGALIYIVTLLLAGVAYFKLIRDRTGRFHHLMPAMFALYCYEFTLTLKQGTLTGDVTFLLFVMLADSLSRIAKQQERMAFAETPLWQT